MRLINAKESSTIGSPCVREIRESELSTVRKLILRTIDYSYPTLYPPRAVQSFKEFHSEENLFERCRHNTLLVIEKDGQIIGTGSLVGNQILAVFVLPEFQNRGYGKLLIENLEQKALESGIKEIELSISLASRRFYEALGFQVLSENSFDVGDGQTLDYWKARKILKAGQLSENVPPKSSQYGGPESTR